MLLVTSLVCLDATAQKAKLKLAGRAMSEFDFVTASEIYNDILTNPKYAKDTTALRNIADCEINLGHYSKAEGYLRRLSETPAIKQDDLHKLASVLKLQKKYPEALLTYEVIATKYPTDMIALGYMENPAFAENIERDSMIYLVRNAGINSSGSDFAPGFFVSGKLLFASSRGLGVGARRYYSWNQQPYLNMYVAAIKADTTLDNVGVLPSRVNTRYHEGSLTYDAANNTMYMTRNNYFKGNTRKSKEGHLKLGIFSYKYTAGEWGAEEVFPHNNREYSVGHPSLTRSGKRVYFTSDMPGGYGGTDIYYCEKESEKWASPKNAGPIVNTAADEMFPFAAGDSVLYFSSRGHLGLGGHDLFYIQMFDSTALPVNVGYPVNSHYDDFAAVVYPDETAGYFSSNRPGGLGDDDVYQFFIRPPVTVEITGRVVEMNSLRPLSNAEVMVEAKDGSMIKVKTDNDGKYVINAPYSKVIRLDAEKQDYVKAGVDVATNPRKTTYTANDIVMRKEDILAVGKVVYDIDDTPAPGAIVRVIDASGTVLDSAYVQTDGTYSVPIPEKSKVTLEVYKDGYVKMTKPIDTSKLTGRKVENNFRLFKLEKGTVVRLDNIYYDYGKSDIRADAAFELDKLVTILKDNPSMSIELSSHTDARGGDAYNLKLSDARANSAVKYIISQGIEAARLAAKGYGETKLLNKCANDVKCSEEEHQFNRRTEFKILDF